jgi:hypothetical protein
MSLSVSERVCVVAAILQYDVALSVVVSGVPGWLHSSRAVNNFFPLLSRPHITHAWSSMPSAITAPALLSLHISTRSRFIHPYCRLSNVTS